MLFLNKNERLKAFAGFVLATAIFVLSGCDKDYTEELNNLGRIYSETKYDNDFIIISKDARKAKYFDIDGIENDEMFFQVGFGEKEGHKQVRGDDRTPEGEYYICDIYPSGHINYWFLYLSYPNRKDALDGLERGIISRSEYNRIVKDNNSYQCPHRFSSLGGAIGLHGNTRFRGLFTRSDSKEEFDEKIDPIPDFTDGCVVAHNKNIDLLMENIKRSYGIKNVSQYKYQKDKIPVVILPLDYDFPDP